MKKLIQTISAISDTVSSTIGKTARLRRFLADRPDLKANLLAPEDNIDMARVPEWQNFAFGATGRGRADHVELKGWRLSGNQMASFTHSDAALDKLVRCTIINDGSSDLQDVHGFAGSKSDLKAFCSTDEMVKTNSSEMISDVSIDGLRNNLNHKEIGLLLQQPTDWLQIHQWDRRLFVVNDGGSHHLAAAKYIAAQIGVPVSLHAPVHCYWIDPTAVARLRAQYDIYLVNDKPELATAFFDAMESFGATWLSHELPKPYRDARAVFLPRAEAPSMRVSSAFRDAGFVDLGQHLEDVASSPTPEVLMRRLHSRTHDLSDANDEQEAGSSAPRP